MMNSKRMVELLEEIERLRDVIEQLENENQSLKTGQKISKKA